MKSFKDFRELEKYIRKNKSEDYFSVNGIVYTMDNYDMEGKEISYGNKKHNKGFLVLTEDRYKQNWKDAIIKEFEPMCFRNDISYFE